ncbi:MAG: DUF459 domain-containing protein [Acidimicrobiia bacterium]
MTEILEAEPASSTDRTAGADTRAERRVRKARRARKFQIVAIAVLVVVAAAVSAGAFLKYRNQAGATASPPPVSVSSQAVTEPARAAVKTRPLTSANPLRLWIAGDSLAGALGPSLGEIAGKTGVVQPQFESRVSSGLASNGIVNWPERAAEEINRLNPEVIVFIIGTNDFPIGIDQSAQPAYEQKVDAMMSLLAQNDRPVYWVGPPILRDPKMNRGVQAVNALFARLAPKHPSITFVDSYKIFSPPDGKYSAKLKNAEGKDVAVRAGDGVHFTDLGGDLLGGVVFDLIDATWKARAQAVPNEPKPVLETAGSTRVAENQGRRTTPATTARGSGRTNSGSETTAPRSGSPSTTSRSTGSSVPATSAAPSTTKKPTPTTAVTPSTASGSR